MLTLRRVSRALRRVALLVILVGPIALAGLEVHGGRRIGVLAREVGRGDERVAAYLRERSPLMDRLLPEGRGGTHFYEDLGHAAGLAFSGAAAIGLSVSAGHNFWPESVELHERAHLIDAFLPAEVARLMAKMPAAAPDEYAATNHGEHFAEMAAEAWQIVSPPAAACVDGTSVTRLEDAELRVPGTAGFVAYYLRRMPAPEDAERGELQALADQLSEPYRDQWEAIWSGVETHRLPDGRFEPWAFHSVREYLVARRAEAALSHRWLDRVAGVLLLPSLAIVTVAGMLV